MDRHHEPTKIRMDALMMATDFIDFLTILPVIRHAHAHSQDSCTTNGFLEPKGERTPVF